MKKGKLVFVTGLIASGKSTLVAELGMVDAGALVLQEPDEASGNAFLADFYADPKRWALTMQMTLLTMRFGQLLEAQEFVLRTGRNAYIDAGYWQDTCFARVLVKTGVLEPREFETYQRMYYHMTKFVRLPDVCVRINCAPAVARSRMIQRYEEREGRRCEEAVSLEYLEALEAEIENMTGVLRGVGVRVEQHVGLDERTTAKRAPAVRDLVSRIEAYTPPDLFSDLHRR